METSNPFETALKEARRVLKEAYDDRSLIEQRIVRLKQTIDGLAALCEPEPEEDFVQVNGGNLPEGYGTSLTDAIRRIFSVSTEPMLTPTEVRDGLLAMGVDIAKYKQPLVPIHNTLKRLVAQYELVEFRDDDNELRGYRWVTPLARAIAEVDSGGRYRKEALMSGSDDQGWLQSDLPAHHPSHSLRNPGPLVRQTPKDFKPQYGYPDPLGRRKK